MSNKNGLTAADITAFGRLRIPPELLEQAGVERVTDREAREKYGINGGGDNSGIAFPYVDATGTRHTCRIRRDCPDIEDGKEKRKYNTPYGDRRHLYIVPGDHALASDPAVPIVLLEAEKSALSLRAFADRSGRKLLPLAMGGCWSWRGRIGKKENSKGQRVDELGPLPELGICKDSRKVYVLLDANANSNPDVQQARNALVRQLLKQKADVHVLDLPEREGVNGPDDFIGIAGDEAMAKLLDSPPVMTAGWRSLLLWRKVAKDLFVPEACIANVITVLQCHPDWAGVIAFDEFTFRSMIRKHTPWADAGQPWTDTDDSRLTAWMQQQLRLMARTLMVAEAVQTVARENTFHPVREYLDGLTWDGTPRLDTWLSVYFGCQDTPFARAVGRRWMISAVARAYQPACQADHCLLLEGEQGRRKSTGVRALAGDEYFADHITPPLGSKDSRQDLCGKWIVELSDLAAIKRTAEVESIKAFISTRVDHYRPSYGRRAVDFPRGNVFAGTTNNFQAFTDPTGSRRFWPVRCGKIDVDAIRRDRDQLWAETVAAYRAGEPWWLETGELDELARAEAEERYEEGVWDGIIRDWLRNPKQRETIEQGGVRLPVEPWDGSEAGRVTTSDILVHAIGKPAERLTSADCRQVANCLRHEGWEQKQDRSRGPHRGKRFWLAPATDGNG